MNPDASPRRRKRDRNDSDRTKGGNLRRLQPWVSEELANAVDLLASNNGVDRREMAERALAAATTSDQSAGRSVASRQSDRTKGGRFRRFDLWIDSELLGVVDAIAQAEQITKSEVFSRAIRSIASVRTPVPSET